MIMRSLYIILFVLCANLLSAQINTGALPASFKHNLSFEQVDHISLYPPNMELIRSEDAEAEKNGTMMKVARLIPFTANIDNSGTWERTSDGKNIWRLRVSSDGAKSCVLHFDEFELPQGSELFVYNPDRTVVLGPYTSTDNDDGGSYAIGVVYGQELIIEYIAPLAKSLTGQVKPIKPIIEMSAFSYFYRGAELYDNRASANFGSSGSCMVNANCSEGNNWRAQQKGVARIYVVEGGYGGWCSGTLVNNTNNDQTPYFLTADHCGGSATSYELGQWIFRFKYESAGCTATSEPSGSNITGCTKKARGPLSGGSDFLLLQLNTTSTNLKNIGVVYNGWTASPSASPSGVSFHHPSGDIKKVSTYTSQLTTVSYGDGAATGAHWMVNWASTAHGHSVTEGGSSGSPIFNNNGLVVGTLTGGSSYCTSPTSPDAYGKFSYHWTSNGTTNDKQLKPWLAPNSSATSCDYLDPNNVGLVCNFSGTPTTVIVGNSVSFTDLSTGGTITSRSWSFPGGSPSSSSSPSPTIIYNTPGTYNVTLTVTAGSQNATETKNGYITVVEQGSGFTYDFEACTNFAVDQFSPCTTYDGDGSYTYSIQTVEFENQNYAGSFIAFNASATNPSLAGGNWDAHGGSKCGACFSATTPPNNDWFITPKINLESNSSFSFWAKTANTNYGKERFNVLISTTNNNISSFTKISTGTYTEAPTTWTKYNYDLNAYNGQGVYLAIQCVSNDAHAFLIDDIEILTSSGGSQNLVADFSGTPTNVTAGNSVSFTDLSTGGTITSRSWSFPGGSPSSSSSPSPTIIYNTPGTYNVSLTVSNGSQNATETKNGYITVAQSTTAPVANFTANTTSGCAPLTVSFSDQSSNNATSWSWIFNGATPSSSISPNPTVIYNTPGIYSVTLTASNAGGSNTKTMTNYITVNDCAPVNDNFASKFSIYPNPTDGIVYIDIPESKATVRISDILGKLVKVANLSSNQSSIDLSTLKSGMYFIEIQLSEAKYTSKLTIQ